MKVNKILIISLSIIIEIISIIITTQAIYNTANPTWKIDFGGQDDTISSYAGLMGALLSFLSIMFVLLNIVEDREKIQQEKKDKQNEEIENYENWFKVINNFLSTIIDDIKATGNNLKEFAKKELEEPSELHNTFFVVNKNFAYLRLIKSWCLIFLNINLKTSKTGKNLYRFV
ncbi:large-conductance mechanosensitive channel [Chryseobacterium ginsenosidimutans]|uniref:hypothetical protein n=1 Tax=Chryseobacterium ginsenosidimutans TaxID=687846 RepID=UPI002786552E|nr:hypothetical protein [Chryseobacterium ginsenosidimutans]MDQ0592719.1 large-conductance mechanosensitive channel [Chryseobacterium ginsenosidimutans]